MSMSPSEYDVAYVPEDGRGTPNHEAREEEGERDYYDGYTYPHRELRYCLPRTEDTYTLSPEPLEGPHFYLALPATKGERFERRKRSCRK